MSAVDDAGNEYSLGFAGTVKSAMLDMVIMTSRKCDFEISHSVYTHTLSFSLGQK